MTTAEIELLPRVAEIVGWPHGLPWTPPPPGKDVWASQLEADGSRTAGILESDLEAHVARRIAEWCDRGSIRREYNPDYGDGDSAPPYMVRLIDDTSDVMGGANDRLEAEMRAVLAWKENHP